MGKLERKNRSLWLPVRLRTKMKLAVIVKGFDGNSKYDTLESAIDEPATISGREAVNLFVRYTGMSRDDIKNFYEAGDISNTEAVTYLQKYADKTADEANTTVTVWEFKLNYPNIDWDESQIAKYNSDAEPYGISVKDFDRYLTERKSCKGTDLDGDGKTDSGSVKSEVLLVIDSLPISNEQKDALYRMNGWSERTINEAPWR